MSDNVIVTSCFQITDVTDEMRDVKDANTELQRDRAKKEALIKELRDDVSRQTQQIERLEEQVKQVRA